jgi:hypothetical protein
VICIHESAFFWAAAHLRSGFEIRHRRQITRYWDDVVDKRFDDGSPEFLEQVAFIMFAGDATLRALAPGVDGDRDAMEGGSALFDAFVRRYPPPKGEPLSNSPLREFYAERVKMQELAAEFVTEYRDDILQIADTLAKTFPKTPRN